MRSVAVWIGYLMYVLFALVTLSIVFYVVNNYVQFEKTKITLKEGENLLLHLDKEIRDSYKIYEGVKKVKIVVPENSILYLKNGTLYILIYSNKFYNFTSKFVNVSIINKNLYYVYNLSIVSLSFEGNLTLHSGEYILIFNKTKDKLIIKV